MIYKILAGFLTCFTALSCAENIPSYSSHFFSSDKQHCRTSFRHIEGGGIGYNKGYTTLEGFFAPDPKSVTLVPFLDVRGHAFDDGKIAANVGVGLRKTVNNRVYGMNAYYDYRNAKKIDYNQVGFGLETLGTRWDVRVNAYIPVGKTITSAYQTKFSKFVNHHMIIEQKYQSAMKGANAELGYHFGKSRFFDFYAAAGTYYYKGKIGPQFWGSKARLIGTCNEYVTIELSNSYDKIFHNRFQCQLTLSLPFGRESQTKQTNNCYSYDTPDALSTRMIQRVTREEIIVQGCRKQNSLAIDSSTRKPLNFVFVDNTSHSNGTYESPYPTLALAQANSKNGDIIYVFPGDGTTQGMDAGITLQRNQKFWGSGVDHSIETSLGNLILPAQSSSAPNMTNIAGDGISLASINQISGFNLTNVIGNGIFGTDVKNIEISDCTIDNSQSDQIHLEYNAIAGSADLNNLVLKNGQLNAISIDAATSFMTCNISNCTIQDNGNNAIDTSFANQATVSLIDSTIERNVSSSNFNFNGPATLLVSGNNFNYNTSISSSPILIIADASPLSATITDNNIHENVCGAIHAALNNTDSAQLMINHNKITNNGTGAIASFGSALFIEPNGTTSGNCYVDVTDNYFSGNTGGALYCTNGNYDNFQVTATGNRITANGGGGLVFANECNALKVAATKNIISNGHDHGISTASIIITKADMSISDNQITGNTNSASAIALSHLGTDLNLIVTNNNMSNNDSSGIILYPSVAIENVAVRIKGNTINNNQNIESNMVGGIDLEQFTNLSGSITDNRLSNNTNGNLFIGSSEPSPNVCLTMSGNSSDTDYTLSSGTGIFNLAPCDVDAINIGTINKIGTINTVQSCPTAVPCAP